MKLKVKGYYWPTNNKCWPKKKKKISFINNLL